MNDGKGETELYKQKNITSILKTELRDQKLCRSLKTENEKGKNTQLSTF